MTTTSTTPPLAEEPVLSTLNPDGSRRWLYPRVSSGRFLSRRRFIAFGLIVLFSGLPFVRSGGRPAILLDLPRREFTLFGTTFLPTDTLLLAFLLLGIFIAIFLATALAGRVWCGWGCPQTVYLEFVYRPLERLLEGRNYTTGGRAPVHAGRRAAKYAVHVLVSLVLAHVFLAYFIGVDRLFDWMHRSPFAHPSAFLVVAATTALMLLDFCFFREQVCTLMCPYGRFQSVLLDRQSLIVSYDRRRGEPRARGRHVAAGSSRGDCIDCGLCVATCPTGIDIREGLQMECIGCAQCIDACDAVMTRLGRPRGLVRYSSQEAMETGRSRLLRPRVVVYPVLLVVAVGLFGVTLARRGSADVTFLRNRSQPYRLTEQGAVANVLTVKITNRSDATRTFDLSVLETDRFRSADTPLRLGPGESGIGVLHVELPRDGFDRGRAEVTVRVSDDAGFVEDAPQHVLGPLFGEASPSGAAP